MSQDVAVEIFNLTAHSQFCLDVSKETCCKIKFLTCILVRLKINWGLWKFCANPFLFRSFSILKWKKNFWLFWSKWLQCCVSRWSIWNSTNIRNKLRFHKYIYEISANTFWEIKLLNIKIYFRPSFKITHKH